MYWLQLVLAMAIATLGLALGSSAVVLGAMLISPLMNPLVVLGMGLAVGSPLLVIRSFGRVASSVFVVLAGAALIAMALPFHEVTAPIAARTSPNALDLLVAICCALMASFTVAASRSTAATTAAGTAVAIALVPPLCVVGFGLGTFQLALARGAGLLFVANFSAIVFFAVLTFTVLGFGELDGAALEAAVLGEAEARSARVTRFRAWLAGRSGGLLRLVLPLSLLALVCVPLRSALREVAWEVGARQAVAHSLDAIAREVVHSSVEVGRHRIRLELVVVGKPQRAMALERAIRLSLSAATGVIPEVHAMAVPDAAALPESVPVAPAPRLDPAPPTLRQSASRLSDVFARAWPSEAAGALLDWQVHVDSNGGAYLEVAHQGPGLGPAAEQMLAEDLSAAAGETVKVGDIALPTDTISGAPSEGDAWLARAAPALEAVARFGSLYACLAAPSGNAIDSGADGGYAGAAALRSVRSHLFESLQRIPAGRFRIDDGVSWTLRIRTDPCPANDERSRAAPSTMLDGGAEDEPDGSRQP